MVAATQFHEQGSCIQITHASRPFSTTPARREAEPDHDNETEEEAVAGFLKDVESGKIPLDMLQEGAEIDPADYKAYAQDRPPRNATHTDPQTVFSDPSRSP